MYCILFLLLYSYTHFSIAQAQLSTPTPQPEITQTVNLAKLHPKWTSRIFSVNTTSPVTKHIRRNPKLDNMIQPVFKYIDNVWGAVKKRRDTNHSGACNLYALGLRDWPTQMRRRAELFQLGYIDDSCYSQVDLNLAMSEGEIAESTLFNVKNVFLEAHQAFANTFTELRMVPDGNWSSDGASYEMKSRFRIRGEQKCFVTSILAHRLKRLWYLRASTTNLPPHVSTPDYQRQFMQEFVPRSGNISLQMTFPNVISGRMERGTTLVTKWKGTGHAVEFGLFDDPLSPLHKAYRRNLVRTDLAADAVTISNIAILILPMTMNLIPLAFFAETPSSAIFFYAIFTDVLSTIPFIMKGVELIRSSRPKRQDVFAFFTGNEDLGTVQSWVVECTGKEKFRVIGILFVMFGISSMVAGIGLEFWAIKYVYSCKSNASDAISVRGPFGNDILKFHTYNILNHKDYFPRERISSYSSSPNTVSSSFGSLKLKKYSS